MAGKVGVGAYDLDRINYVMFGCTHQELQQRVMFPSVVIPEPQPSLLYMPSSTLAFTQETDFQTAIVEGLDPYSSSVRLPKMPHVLHLHSIDLSTTTPAPHSRHSPTPAPASSPAAEKLIMHANSKKRGAV
jgi:hypothetical protein